MRRIVYSCPFVPAEWIAAHRLRPSRILPGLAGAAPGRAEGLCPYAEAFGLAASADASAEAIVATTVCDQMRRLPDVLAAQADRPVFLLNVPATWETPASHRYYLDELKRLGRFLVALGGAAPEPAHLAAVMRDYDTARSHLRAARGRLSAVAYAEAIAEFHRLGDPVAARGVPDDPAGAVRGAGVPVALLGGPMRREDFAVFRVIEEAGGTVVLNGTESGERTLPAPFDRRRLRDDPLMELADAYFGAIPDASRRPNHELYRWLKRETVARGVRGIIVWRYLWCDIWHAEVQRLKEWEHLPVLALDAADNDQAGSWGGLLTRVQAFLEILS